MTFTLSGYRITENKTSAEWLEEYGAFSEGGDKAPVIIRVFPFDYYGLEYIPKLRQLYKAFGGTPGEHSRKLHCVRESDSGFVAVVDADEGHAAVCCERFELSSFLKSGITVCGILNGIHGHGSVYGNIRASNITVCKDDGKIELKDPGSLWYIFEKENIKADPAVLAAVVPYISPEQTGRLAMEVDARSDLYSLGVVLFEMLTGKLPFSSNDSLEIIHAHIAKKPDTAVFSGKDIPQVVIDIVLRLLSKNPDDRYQSAQALEKDLRKCLDMLENTGNITWFQPAGGEISKRYITSSKLCGRSNEKAELENVFMSVYNGGREFVTVCGPAGIGKTALVNEIKNITNEKGGHFIIGKYDQIKNDTPYSGIITAFQSLMKSILSLSADEVSAWGHKIKAAAGINGRIIAEIIPELELVTGKLEPVAALGAIESENRFTMAVQKYVGALCSTGHPLVLFLDDLQWADGPSLKLISTIMADRDIKGLMIVGTYRNNVPEDHPIFGMIETVRVEGSNVNEIALKAVQKQDINEIIGGIIGTQTYDIEFLCDIVHRKSKGNPLYIIQYLQILFSEGVLHLSDEGKWVFDKAHLGRLEIPDDIIKLMVGKIAWLPKRTRDMLKYAGCIGNRFPQELLARACGRKTADVREDIELCINSGLIVEDAEQYRFVHDHIQETIYSKLNSEDAMEMHHRIGSLLLAQAGENNIQQDIFAIVDQLNHAIGRMNHEEKNKLIELNLLAGRRAKVSAAYASAAAYFAVAISMLESDCWETSYDLSMTLHRELHENEYLNENYSRAEELFNVIIEKSHSIIERSDLYRIKAALAQRIGRSRESVESGLKGLEILGLRIPIKAGKFDMLVDLIKMRWAMSRHPVNYFVNMPEMTDPVRKQMAAVMKDTLAAAYCFNTDLFIVLQVKLFNMNVRYGNSPYSSPAYLLCGLVLGSVFGKYRMGYDYGKASFEIAKRFNDRSSDSMISFSFSYFINNWVNRVETSLEYAYRGYDRGLELGDFVFGGYGAGIAGEYLLYTQNLNSTAEQIEKYIYVTEKIRHKDMQNLLIGAHIFLCLMTKTSANEALTKEEYDEAEYTARNEAEKRYLSLSFYYVHRAWAHYLFDEYDKSLEICGRIKELKHTIFATFYSALYNFYHSLTLAALYDGAGVHKKLIYRAVIGRNQRAMKKWANSCPENFMNKYLLVRAEQMRILGRHKKALELYERSIEHALKNKFYHEAGTSNELAAKLYISKGEHVKALKYLSAAKNNFAHWGAIAKVEHIEKTYGEIAGKISASGQLDTGYGVVDVASVVKASQAISEEITFDRLAEKLVRIMMENTGAQNGRIILERAGGLFVMAEGDADKGIYTALKGLPVEISPHVSVSIINFVWHGGKDVVLGDARADASFGNDDYIKNNGVKSVLCTAIWKKGSIVGIVYLENNHITNAFTPGRLELMKLLFAQAAISLENARLYEDLENRVELRTRELSETNTKLIKEVEERKKIEEQFLQSQKMEAIGKLAGGIAHDFNNLMTTVLGNASLLLEYLKGNKQGYIEASEIQTAGERAASLTKQLLAFSRKQMLDMKELDVNEIVRETCSLSKRLIGEDIVFKSEYTEDIWKIKGDHAQIGQMLLNIVINARDAMPSGGEILMQTRNVQVDEEYCRCTGIGRAGKHVVLTIEDNGTGMNEEVKRRIFEPFFTTKGVGKGTGLGLSTAYGIASQHGGWINVYSEIGNGSVFKVYIPAHEGSSAGAVTDEESNILLGKNERILVVEDEDGVRRFAVTVLKRNGYQVFEAANAASAFALFEQEKGRFDILFSDVVLPDKLGTEIAGEMWSKNNKLKILLASGYTGEKSQMPLIEKKGYDFLQKPYTIRELLDKIQKFTQRK